MAVVSATWFELTFTPGGFMPRFVGSGSDQAATFSVDPSLGGATADATIMLERCDEMGCVPVRPIALAVDWTGQGDIRTFRSHYQFRVEGGRGNTVATGESRQAVPAATVDGAPFTGFPAITASIQHVSIHSTTR